MSLRLIYISAALLTGIVAILWSMGNKIEPTPAPRKPKGKVETAPAAREPKRSVEPAAAPIPLDMKDVDRIVVLKGKRRMDVYSSGRVIRKYRIALGSRPVGDKI